jgi:serine/threonine protein kinase
MRSEEFKSSALSDFVIQQELGHSATGAVFKALYKGNNQIYALKKKVISDSQTRTTVLNEVNLLQQLNHENIVTCYGSFWDTNLNHLYIILEFCENGDLRGLINRFVD